VFSRAPNVFGAFDEEILRSAATAVLGTLAKEFPRTRIRHKILQFTSHLKSSTSLGAAITSVHDGSERDDGAAIEQNNHDHSPYGMRG